MYVACHCRSVVVCDAANNQPNNFRLKVQIKKDFILWQLSAPASSSLVLLSPSSWPCFAPPLF